MGDTIGTAKESWQQRAAKSRRMRLLGWVAALLFYPFTQVFPVYVALDRVYQSARGSCGGYDTAAGCYRRDLEMIQRIQSYHCQVAQEQSSSVSGAQKLVERLRGVTDLTPLNVANHSFLSWLSAKPVPLFRQGFSIYEADLYADMYGGEIWNKVSKHCEEQYIRFLRGQPVEPIAIYDEVRAVLRETIRRYDAAIAGYARIRLLFGVIMWGWAAAELAGLVLFLGIAREDWQRFKRARAEQRGSGG